MNCAEAQRMIPGYIDGALPESGQVRAGIGSHLNGCGDCRLELQRYVQLSMMMSKTKRAAAPRNLDISIRLAVARARENQGIRSRLRRCRSRMHLVLENLLEPLALPATGGVLAALVVFAIMHQFLGISVPLSAAASDLPTVLFQPARLETLAGFQISGLDDTAADGQHALLVEAQVSAAGEAVSYRVISGVINRVTQRELDQLLLFSRFRPRLNFGRPTSGGRVILSFSRISVRG